MSTKKFIGIAEIEAEFGPLTFSGALKSHRVCDEMTQTQMAKLLKISKQSLNDLEKGRKIPSIRRTIDIARKLGIFEEVLIQLVLQDQIRKEKLNFTVTVRKTG